ncbi:MAG: prepilin-type N-terminal cleavage/methylation domain-containing protein [Pyrinomonadaceae bacterium]|nr:prepilin-type N-terminal cleavage/methylation domain-containing protein [Pyrinomonadaceae bacterium]
MFRSLLKEEHGYTLIEVMVSIMIMTLAILPMVAMFDTGLHSATASSNYDKARTLANLKLEEAKSLPFDSTDATIRDLNDNFPEAAGTTTTYTSGAYESAWKTVTGPASAEFSNFQYKVKKEYMAKPTEASVEWVPSPTPTDLIRITVTVRWADGNEYRTLGLASA